MNRKDRELCTFEEHAVGKGTPSGECYRPQDYSDFLKDSE